jgi:hypothetical protein
VAGRYEAARSIVRAGLTAGAPDRYAVPSARLRMLMQPEPDAGCVVVQRPVVFEVPEAAWRKTASSRV